MSEETKQPAEETPEEPQEAPQEEAPPAEEKVPDEKAEKAARGKKKKEKTYTLTREQMEAAELAARQLESVKDQFVRLTHKIFLRKNYKYLFSLFRLQSCILLSYIIFLIKFL